MHAYTRKTISVQLSHVEPPHVLREGDCALTTGLTLPHLLYGQDANLHAGSTQGLFVRLFVRQALNSLCDQGYH